jgi:GNAT superfamily N-acetyltransferase
MSGSGANDVSSADAAPARVWRSTRADLAVLLEMIRDFNLMDRHPHDDDRVREALIRLLDGNEFGQVWQIATGDGARGYCVIAWSYSLESGGRECIVDEIFVTDRGRGLGAQLLEGALRGARRAGVKVAFLETEAHNERVRSFYRRHGFIGEDSIWMRRAL